MEEEEETVRTDRLQSRITRVQAGAGFSGRSVSWVTPGVAGGIVAIYGSEGREGEEDGAPGVV